MTRPTTALVMMLTALAGACGAKVVIDHAAGGAGGGDSASSSSGIASSSSTSSSSTTTSAGGALTLCFMGNNPACQPCAAAALMPGGPCAAAFEACIQSNGACGDFGSCSGGCDGDQPCCDKCAATFPEGAKGYGGVWACVACEACPADCAGVVQPGFCP